jgi:LysR family glycine cleavage system transcriptional activator
MRRAPNLSTIEAFLAAAELGGFRAAADRLCLSAPAITRRIQALERHQGTALFERRAGGVTLTAAGRDLKVRMGPALDEVRAALLSPHDPATPVRLRASRSIVGLWLAPRLARLPKGVSLDVRSDLTLEACLGGGADLGIFFDPRPMAPAISERLLPVEITVVSAPRLADGRVAPSDVDDLSSYSLIELAGQPSIWPRASPGGRATLVFDGIQAMYEATASGLGLAPGIRPLVDPYLASRRLVELTAFGRVQRGAYYLVAARQALRSRKVAEVRDWLMCEAGGSALESHS